MLINTSIRKSYFNIVWDGRKFRLLNIVDDYNREVLSVETDISLPASRLIRVLGQLKEHRGLLLMIP